MHTSYSVAWMASAGLTRALVSSTSINQEAPSTLPCLPPLCPQGMPSGDSTGNRRIISSAPQLPHQESAVLQPAGLPDTKSPEKKNKWERLHRYLWGSADADKVNQDLQRESYTLGYHDPNIFKISKPQRKGILN